MAAGKEAYAKLATFENSQKWVPIICFEKYVEIYEQSEILEKKGFDVRIMNDTSLEKEFRISKFELLKESQIIHKSMINGSLVEYWS